MSLGIAIKGPEGVVLAADSRVTLFNQIQVPNTPHPLVIPATFDNAKKLLKVKGQDYVAAVTYGAGAIGQQQPRTAHSFLPEFETAIGNERLSIQDFATRLSNFFMQQWQAENMPPAGTPNLVDMVFLVAGYDENSAYGKVFEMHIPSNPTPMERFLGGEFGATWGGQRSITDRILQGFDSAGLDAIYGTLQIPQQQRNPIDLENQLKARLALKIPIQFLSLQDCVDLAILLTRATILMQNFTTDVRGVGGAVDVITITRTEGFKAIQLKQVIAENII